MGGSAFVMVAGLIVVWRGGPDIRALRLVHPGNRGGVVAGQFGDAKTVLVMRWGLIGGSDIAATRMVPAMRALGQPISAVASSTPGARRGVCDRTRHPLAAADVDALLAREDVDAVYISTVNHLHGPHTLAAAAAGKHVLCEKPVALDLPEAWSMVRACDDRRCRLRGQSSPAVTHHAHRGPTAGRRWRDRHAEGCPGLLRLPAWRSDCAAGG